MIGPVVAVLILAAAATALTHHTSIPSAAAADSTGNCTVTSSSCGGHELASLREDRSIVSKTLEEAQRLPSHQIVVLAVTSPEFANIRSFPGGPSAQTILRVGMTVHAKGVTFKVIALHNGVSADLDIVCTWSIQCIGNKPSHPFSVRSWQSNV